MCIQCSLHHVAKTIMKEHRRKSRHVGKQLKQLKKMLERHSEILDGLERRLDVLEERMPRGTVRNGGVGGSNEVKEDGEFKNEFGSEIENEVKHQQVKEEVEAEVKKEASM